MIDAHHHLWRYSPEDYGWISPEMKALQRDFLPADLTAELASAGVTGSVAVQARQSLAETRWLLDCARQTPAILGVVGWAPLVAPNLRDLLAPLAQDARLKGLRHVVQDEPDDEFLLRDDFNRGVDTLLEFDLAYDLLILRRHLPQAVTFVRRHPHQRFVLDHLAKPAVARCELEPWRSDLAALAACPNVFCKLSGLVTEADWATWSPQDLIPYLDCALEAFGPARVMAGSDWPVCLLASTYRRWWKVLRDWAEPLSISEQEAMFNGTARSFYGLPA